MDVTNCKDINGNSISEITLNEDGTVLAVLVINGVSSTSKLSVECCESNNYTYDPVDSKCYWATTCGTGGSYKIILDPVDTTGAVFQVDEGENCTLEVELDYIIKFDCETLSESLKDTIESLKIELSLEKVVYDATLPIPNNLESVQKEDILNTDDSFLILNGNENTGISLEGNGCDALVLNLVNSLPVGEQSRVTETSFHSTWVRHKMVVDDPSTLAKIYNEHIKVVVIGNNLLNFSLLIDNVKLNRVCNEIVEIVTEEDCPSFDLTRVIDNKKSWVGESIPETRNFDLSRRLTNYDINDERLSINTKEIDLLINPSNAIEGDVWQFIIDNPCILQPAIGCTSGDLTHSCVDISALISTPMVEMTKGTELLSQLVDVKTRKTLRSYPLIELLYYRYINSEEHCGVASNSLNIDSVETFVDLVAAFWSDIIEQVVPATTIWGSSYQHSNSVFGSDKFTYTRSTLNIYSTPIIEAPSPTYGTSDVVDIVTVDVTDTTYTGPPELEPEPSTQTGTGITVIQTEDGSEFIGTITILGGTDPIVTTSGTTSGNTITINETITDTCHIYNSDGCVDTPIGDFYNDDFSASDFGTQIK